MPAWNQLIVSFMNPGSTSPSQAATFRIQRIAFPAGTQGQVRVCLAVCAWMAASAALLSLVINQKGEFTSFMGPDVKALLLVFIIFGLFFLCIASQLVRGSWEVESGGVREMIRPWKPLFPFGLRGERFVSWPKIASHGIRDVSRKGVCYRYFRISIDHQPLISLQRRGKINKQGMPIVNDEAFDGFVEEFERLKKAWDDQR
jgi:hypothetical protein